MRKRNYQRELDAIVKDLEQTGQTPRLLLHACCAPCSSYVLEYLSQFFSITVFYYNPNIYPGEEYAHRVAEIRRLINEMRCPHPVSLVEGPYDTERFFETAKGMEDLPEGGERCFACYELRLRQAAALAKENGFDYFTTTLSISPLKNADKLNEIGEELAKEYGVRHLPADFKKREGYKRSIVLSKEYGLYRQDYCGCIFSQKEAQRRKQDKL